MFYGAKDVRLDEVAELICGTGRVTARSQTLSACEK
jgi:hypothetical protein